VGNEDGATPQNRTGDTVIFSRSNVLRLTPSNLTNSPNNNDTDPDKKRRDVPEVEVAVIIPILAKTRSPRALETLRNIGLMDEPSPDVACGLGPLRAGAGKLRLRRASFWRRG
jgi:hypothetical protein